jgi:hypothetical protein
VTQWGVKFDLTGEPESFVYALGNGGQNEVAFIGTTESEKLGGSCEVSHNGVGGVLHSKTILAPDMPSRLSPLNGENPIGGYYYYYSHPQALCSDGSAANTAVETKATAAVKRIVKTIRSK